MVSAKRCVSNDRLMPLGRCEFDPCKVTALATETRLREAHAIGDGYARSGLDPTDADQCIRLSTAENGGRSSSKSTKSSRFACAVRFSVVNDVPPEEQRLVCR